MILKTTSLEEPGKDLDIFDIYVKQQREEGAEPERVTGQIRPLLAMDIEFEESEDGITGNLPLYASFMTPKKDTRTPYAGIRVVLAERTTGLLVSVMEIDPRGVDYRLIFGMLKAAQEDDEEAFTKETAKVMQELAEGCAKYVFLEKMSKENIQSLLSEVKRDIH